MDTPSVYVFDCSNAGLIVKTFHQILKQRKEDGSTDGTKENIILAACGENEILPMNPEYPAGFFILKLLIFIRFIYILFNYTNSNCS